MSVRSEQPPSTLSVLVMRVVEVAVQRSGGRFDAIASELALTPEALRDPETRLPSAVVFGLFDRIAGLGEDAFLPRLAQSMPVGSFDALDFALRSSSTMGDALQRCARYFPILDDACELTIETDGGTARLVTRRSGGQSPLAATAFLFALVLDRGRIFTGHACPVREVRFRRDTPPDAPAYERLFGAPVRFGRSRNELLFDAAWLATPCLADDAPIASYLDRQLGTMLARLPRAADLLDDLRRVIALGIRGSSPSLEASAHRLAVSPRTLQRRLLEHGGSYRALVEEVRRDESLRLVRETDLPLCEVAYLVGFAELSSFHRAFRRWSDLSPAALRRDRR